MDVMHKQKKLLETLDSLDLKAQQIIDEWKRSYSSYDQQRLLGLRIHHSMIVPHFSSIALSPDGTRLACGTKEGTVVLANALTPEIEHIFEVSKDRIRHISWSPDGTYFAVDGNQNCLVIFHSFSGELIHTLQIYDTSISQEYEKIISAIEWSPDGQFLASGYSDKAVVIWKVSTGTIFHTLATSSIKCLAWSPDSTMLASSSHRTINIWSLSTGKSMQTLQGHMGTILSLVWASDGHSIISGDDRATVRTWNVTTGSSGRAFESLPGPIVTGLWNYSSNVILAKTSGNQASLLLLDCMNGLWSILIHLQTDSLYLAQTLMSILPPLRDLAYDRDLAHTRDLVRDLALTLEDNFAHELALTLDYAHAHELALTLAHNLALTLTQNLASTLTHDHIPVSALAHGRVPDLAFTLTCDLELSLNRALELDLALARDPALEHTSKLTSAATYHSNTSFFTIAGEQEDELIFWHLDKDQLSAKLITPQVQYTNAKVVLIGETGVGKTGLGLALSKEGYQETESTHGRYVWTLRQETVSITPLISEERELLLWDMAGQQGYRVVHQLYLDDVSVALIVFDGRRELNPFEGVYYWTRALQQARKLQGTAVRPQRRFLVAARNDRGGIGVSRERIEQVTQELGLDGYIETSAKFHIGIDELRTKIIESIAWSEMLKVSTTEFFQKTKQFLINRKEQDERWDHVILWELDVLYNLYLSNQIVHDTEKIIRKQFEIAIDLVAQTGLIKRLSFGTFLLLQPEYLDRYASALVMAVRDEPDGLGLIAEEAARRGDFCSRFMTTEERVSDPKKEQLLLLAMIEDLLNRDLTVRADDHLVFPAQTTVLYPTHSPLPGISIVFDFEGPIANIYTILAVRLIRSGLFRTHPATYENTIEYSAKVGGKCGIFLENRGEGAATLTLFFDPAQPASEGIQYLFEEYVAAHLERYALNVKRIRLYICPQCDEIMPQTSVAKRLEMGLKYINCPTCETRIALVDREERLFGDYQQQVADIEESARLQREKEVLRAQLEGRRMLNDYDAFFCYNVADSKIVHRIASKLMEYGLLPWLFEDEQRPGSDWRHRLEDIIATCKAGVVFQSNRVPEAWQNREITALLSRADSQNLDFSVIPVILPETIEESSISPLLSTRHEVDFRKIDPNPLESLIWGITGKRPIPGSLHMELEWLYEENK
jgi:GTPase SAR1 family protein/DNA-directed RNA polymerase subunit RPC12/RpoP